MTLHPIRPPGLADRLLLLRNLLVAAEADCLSAISTEAENPPTPSSSSDRAAVLRPPTPEGGAAE